MGFTMNFGKIHFKEENFSERHIGLNEVDKRKLLKKPSAKI